MLETLFEQFIAQESVEHVTTLQLLDGKQLYCYRNNDLDTYMEVLITSTFPNYNTNILLDLIHIGAIKIVEIKYTKERRFYNEKA